MSKPSNHLLATLRARELEGRPIRVGIVGTGDYGESLVAQLRQIPGIRSSVVCDLDLDRAAAAYQCAGISGDELVRGGSAATIDNAVTGDKPVITDDYRQVLQSPVDVIVDCTGEPNFGCELALGAIHNGKHVVMVNVEADITAGAQLADAARKANLVYTLADGDQPSLIVGLTDWAEGLGFSIVAAGKWTTLYPEEVANAKLAERANPKKSDVTYFDGSKSQIEMASAANAAGLEIDIPGMHKPGIRLGDIADRLRPVADGGMLNHRGVVEIIDCRTLSAGDCEPGGVFIVVTSAAERALQAMASKGVPASADKRHFMIHRPYHLVGAETPRSIILAALEGVPTAVPASRPTVDVVAVSKRRLAAGTRLAGLGSADVRGIALNASDAAPFLPLGLTDDAVLTRDIEAGSRLVWEDVVPPENSQAWSLRLPGRNLS